MFASEILAKVRAEGLPATKSRLYHALYSGIMTKPEQRAGCYIFTERNLDEFRHYLLTTRQGKKAIPPASHAA